MEEIYFGDGRIIFKEKGNDEVFVSLGLEEDTRIDWFIGHLKYYNKKTITKEETDKLRKWIIENMYKRKLKRKKPKPQEPQKEEEEVRCCCRYVVKSVWIGGTTYELMNNGKWYKPASYIGHKCVVEGRELAMLKNMEKNNTL